jgi:hypothetical protein
MVLEKPGEFEIYLEKSSRKDKDKKDKGKNKSKDD